jgi:hypothetical protein
MRWFRRRRIDLGTYTPQEPAPLAPVEQIVREGALIGESVVRLTLRNRVIVDALRDHLDLDLSELGRLAAKELEALADQEWESAERVRLRRSLQRSEADYDGLDLERLQESLRRERVHREMSDAFAARSTDVEAIEGIVERSRGEAWSEIAEVLIVRAGERALVLDRDPLYERERAARIDDLLTIDLAQLAEARGRDASVDA